MIMALGEGPIVGINQIWRDQSIYTLGGAWSDAVQRSDAAKRMELSGFSLSVAGARLSGHCLRVRFQLQSE